MGRFVINTLGEACLQRPEGLSELGNKAFDAVMVALSTETLADDQLTAQQAELRAFLDKAQYLNNSRFRCWGDIVDGKASIYLDTEFLWWVDDKEHWKQLGSLAKKLEAELEAMYEGPHCDQRKENGGPWIEGPNHGRMERQVAMTWTFGIDTNLRDIVSKIMSAAFHTHDMWAKCGVAVI